VFYDRIGYQAIKMKLDHPVLERKECTGYCVVVRTSLSIIDLKLYNKKTITDTSIVFQVLF